MSSQTRCVSPSLMNGRPPIWMVRGRWSHWRNHEGMGTTGRGESCRFYRGDLASSGVFGLKIAPGQVQTKVEFLLVVVRLHVLAQLVEGLVVFGLFEVRQLVHHDHPEELRRRVAEQGRDADFLAR